MAITRALSDASRVRTLLALRQGELCVCQITELFGFAPSTVSKHLSILQQAGLVRSRKSERWVYYRLADRSAPVAVREALDWVHKSLAQTDEAAADAKKLKVIQNTDLVVIMGGNAAEAHPCGFKWVTEALEHRKAKLIVVDPRFTRSAAIADYYAPIRSGSDIAFLLGFADQASFTRAFRRWTGKTPSEFMS